MPARLRATRYSLFLIRVFLDPGGDVPRVANADEEKSDGSARHGVGRNRPPGPESLRADEKIDIGCSRKESVVEPVRPVRRIRQATRQTRNREQRIADA